MKKTILLMGLVFASFTTLAAEEVSKKDVEGMQYTQKITTTCSMMGDCQKKIAKMAEEKKADYFVVTEAGREGMGDSMLIVAELYKKM